MFMTLPAAIRYRRPMKTLELLKACLEYEVILVILAGCSVGGLANLS